MRYEAAGTGASFLKQRRARDATVTKSPKHGLERRFGLRRPDRDAAGSRLGLAESILSVDVEAGGREAPWAPATSSTPGRRVDGRAVRCSACAARDGSRRLVIEVARRVGVDDDAFSASTGCALSYALRGRPRLAAAPTDGACADASVEVAGLGDAGDARFVKAEGALQNHIQLAKLKNGFVALGGVARIGAALPLFGSGILDLAMPDRVLPAADLYDCGPPLRRRRGSPGARRPLLAGDATALPAVGGALLWAASLILSAPVPGDLGRPGCARWLFSTRAGSSRPRARVTNVADGRDAALLRTACPRAGGMPLANS